VRAGVEISVVSFCIVRHLTLLRHLPLVDKIDHLIIMLATLGRISAQLVRLGTSRLTFIVIAITAFYLQ